MCNGVNLKQRFKQRHVRSRLDPWSCLRAHGREPPRFRHPGSRGEPTDHHRRAFRMCWALLEARSRLYQNRSLLQKRFLFPTLFKIYKIVWRHSFILTHKNVSVSSENIVIFQSVCTFLAFSARFGAICQISGKKADYLHCFWKLSGDFLKIQIVNA